MKSALLLSLVSATLAMPFRGDTDSHFGTNLEKRQMGVLDNVPGTSSGEEPSVPIINPTPTDVSLPPRIDPDLPMVTGEPLPTNPLETEPFTGFPSAPHPTSLSPLLSGVYPTGIFPPGCLPTGIFPTGSYATGVFPTGIFPTGGYATGVFPTGCFPTTGFVTRSLSTVAPTPTGN